MKSLEDIYSSKPSNRSLNSFKQESLNIPCTINVIPKSSQKTNNWVGYSSSSDSERLDSDSEHVDTHNDYIESLSKGIEIDEVVRTVPQKKFKSSADITWLGVKPKYLESHSLAPAENTKTIYRDKLGAVIDKQTKSKKQENEEKLQQWASGEVQLQAKRKLEQELEKEKTKPFARYEIEPEFDSELKKRDRFGDPVHKFQKSSSKNPGLAWENRFSIAPGKMWDGVDRTNGFEQRWLAKQGRKVWENSMAHKAFASEL